MRRIALMFIAALVALIGLVPLASTAQAGPSVEAAAYTYDTPEYDPPGNGAASQRGPPAQSLATTACDADRWSRGTLARSDVLAAPAITTYGYLGTPARVARPMTTTGAHVVLVDGDRSSLSRFGVAAKTTTSLADEAAGLLGNADDVVVLGRQVDTAVAKGWDGHVVLDTPNWSLELNDAFIRGAIQQQRSIYLASPLKGNLIQTSGRFAGQPTVYARELQMLREAGYTRVGDYMVP